MLRSTREYKSTIFAFSHTRLSLSLATLSRVILLTQKFIAQTLHCLHHASHYTCITTHANLHNTGLDYSQFAHHYYGNHIRFIFLALLRCFSSRRSHFYSIYSNKSFLSLSRKVSPFGHLRITANLSTPRSFSQTITSFIASRCQGIHQMLFPINQN